MHRSRGRPDPVSCQSCRSKKLKCNRVQPCSNCTARGITCTFLVAPQKQAETASTTQSNAELLERIERLEDIIRHSVPVETNAKHALDGGSITRPLAGTPLSLTPGSGIVVCDSGPSRDDRDEDTQLLENVATREDSLLSSLSNGLAFEISGMHHILERRTYLQSRTPASQNDRPKDTMVTFPEYKVALQLFQSYQSNVDHMVRVLHIPTIRSLVTNFYLRLNQNESILPGHAALLLSIFALGAFFYYPTDNSEIAPTEQDFVYLSKVLSKGALDVLDYSRRNTSGTLEDIQAYVLMSIVTFHLDGFSARGRLLSNAAASLARDLCLQRVDADGEFYAEKDISVRTLIDREVKRRVFWFIASTDWMFSSVSGPQEGMYFIHPNHITVKLPRDCNDDDLALDDGNQPDLGPQPTGMTYFLEKIRLAHLCREIVDVVPMETSKLRQMPYEQIIAMDQKVVDYISSLPFFFRLDAESRKQTKPLEAMYPIIPLMRYCITSAAHSRRCKLHQRFLLRQSCNPRYVYSRRACLESARAVIHFYDGLAGQYPLHIVSARMGLAVHFMHLALVVLVMDVCFNKDEADEAEVKADVKAGLQMFEDTRHISPLLDRFFNSLCHILQKHKVNLSDKTASPITQPTRMAQQTDHDALKIFDDDLMQVAQLGMDLQAPGTTFDTSFEEFWQSIQGDPSLDLLAWDSLFSALDTRPL